MAWLPALSDPAGRTANPSRAMHPEELGGLIEAASAHGVLPVFARNLRTLAADGGRGLAAAPGARQALDAARRSLDERLVLLAGQQLLLAHHADRIAKAFSQAALPAAVIKGPIFASRLYPTPADRAFTDIDVLLDHARLDAANEVLRQLGFIPAQGILQTGRDYREHKWTLPDDPVVLVELQTDLIHSPSLRRGISFRYPDLLAAGNGDPTDATALLMVAALHGAAGDQFERLQPAVDVLQAARGAAGVINAERLVSVAASTGSAVALHAALDLTARLFGGPEVTELAGRFAGVPWRRLRRRLVSPTVALRSQTRTAWRDSWRRRALREMIRRIGAPRHV